MKKIINPRTQDYYNLKNIVLSSDFSWYWVGTTTPIINLESDPPYFSHCVLRRPNDNGSGYLFPFVSSSYIDSCNTVLKQILNFNKIEVNSILRINFNLTIPGNIEHTKPHYDHEFDHKNLIIYFTDSGGKTMCEEEQIDPNEDDVVLFSGLHYHYLPKNGRRVVMVTTFV